MWAKWSGTHQDRSGSWWKSVLGSALDANGNTLSDPSGKSYSWDFENRLTQAAVPGTNGGTTTFRYDPFGRRIQKSGPLGTTNYLYDGLNLLEEVNNSSIVLARYTNTWKIDEPLAMSRGGTTSYYEADGLDSISSLSNSGGASSNTYTYDSSGNLVASTGGLINPFQFTGREFDPETSLYEYRSRYYAPQLGRFISEDPIRFGGGNDFYAYVGNSPVNWVDPQGLCPKYCNTRPQAPLAPPGVSVDFNIMLTNNAMRDIGADYTGTQLDWFYNMVNTGNPWDYKQQGDQYTNFGNFNYGASCTAMGWSPDFCQGAAALARDYRAYKLDLPLGKGIPFLIPPYGDQSADQVQIEHGYDYFIWKVICQQ
jgi:RHS repeat-associated protein